MLPIDRELSRSFSSVRGASIKVAQSLRELAGLWPELVRLRPANILEIGIEQGGWSSTMCPTFAPGARILGIDPETTAAPAAEYLTRAGFAVHWFTGVSQDRGIRREVIAALKGVPLDVLHVDGDHSFPAVLDDWVSYSGLVRPGGLVIFHDSHTYGEEVGEALRFIRKRRAQRVTYWASFNDAAHPHGGFGITVAQMGEAHG